MLNFSILILFAMNVLFVFANLSGDIIVKLRKWYARRAEKKLAKSPIRSDDLKV